MKKFPNKPSGFTLVELIVVITILVILGTIGFVSLQGYSLSARDSVRVENLSNLHKGLTLFNIVSSSYPLPESFVTITASGTDIGYQGFAKDLVGGIAKLSRGATTDPLDPSISTTYSVNASKTKMQLMSFLEDGNSTLTFVPNAYASIGSDYSKRSFLVKGDGLGILLASGSLQPVQESGTGVDVVLTNSGYVALFTPGISTNGTGSSLITAFSTNSPDGKGMSKYDKSLVGYWDMETTAMSGSQVVMKDLSQSGNNGACYIDLNQVSCGINTAGPQMVDSKSRNGKEINLQNSGAYLKMDKNYSLTPDFSFTFKFTPTGTGGNADCWNTNLLGQHSDGSCNQNTWGFGYTAHPYSAYHDKHISVQYGDGTPTGWKVTISKATIYWGISYTIGYTRTNIGRSKLFINGVLDSEFDTTGMPLNNSFPLRFGNSVFPPDMLKGFTDEVRIYNRALSDSEIQTLYNATK